MPNTNLLKMINSSKDLKEKLKHDNIPCKIPYRSSLQYTLDKYPILRLFLAKETFSSKKFNSFVGYKFLPKNSLLTSYTINSMLLELNKLKFKNYPVCRSKIELRAFLNNTFFKRSIENFVYNYNNQFYITNSYYKDSGLYVTDFVNVFDDKEIIHTAISRMTSYCYELLDNNKFKDAKVLPLSKKQSIKFIKHLEGANNNAI